MVSGGGEAALAKLRLLSKTGADVQILAEEIHPDISRLADASNWRITRRRAAARDIKGATLVYAANENAETDANIATAARARNSLVNIVDNLEDSGFITPAIVDRDPVTVAIGTEGAAPVLARAIKRDLEERLPTNLGLLARIGKAFRPMAEKLPFGRARRDFWADYYLGEGRGFRDPQKALDTLLDKHLNARSIIGHVDFVGAGPGDPELLTLKARNALDRADVVIHDRLVPAQILELARREAILVDVGKTGFAESTPQDSINTNIVEHARKGHHVVRLKGGDPTIFGRMDEEIEALEAADIPYSIIPGITAASAAAAELGQSLTRRGRNSSIHILTGHDVRGFAEHDWRALVQPDAISAIYMGKRAARFIQGRLLMHGAQPGCPVSIVENASRTDQRIFSTTIADMAEAMNSPEIGGPVLTFIGIAPRDVEFAPKNITKDIAL